MHIFLTGEIQIGKSTIIAKTLALLQLTPGGFMTYFGTNRHCPNKVLYISHADKPNIFNEENAVAFFYADKQPRFLPEKFDTYGAELRKSANKGTKLILMDECGSIERDALIFQQAVLAALADDTPVLGVVKLDSTGWTDQIRNHPRVELITVTRENRDELPALLAQKLTHKASNTR